MLALVKTGHCISPPNVEVFDAKIITPTDRPLARRITFTIRNNYLYDLTQVIYQVRLLDQDGLEVHRQRSGMSIITGAEVNLDIAPNDTYTVISPLFADYLSETVRVEVEVILAEIRTNYGPKMVLP